MNAALVDGIVKAVLYEGYMLYPYRPSAVKNRQRFNFGVVYPRAYSEAQGGTDAWTMQTECVVVGSDQTRCQVRLKFLHMVSRTVEKSAPNFDDSTSEKTSDFQRVESLEVEGQRFQAWQEAVEEEIEVAEVHLATLVAQPMQWPFRLAAKLQSEPIQDSNGRIVGMICREQEALAGRIELSVTESRPGVYKLTAHIANNTRTEGLLAVSRDEALMRALVSAHTILEVQEGEFVSLVDPPEQYREEAVACKNVGTWPVLVGEEGQRDTMLSSPIILYDYPQIAPESGGDLFDGAEIDEILTLRIMTMTDEEKREMRQSDARARQILERTEALPAEQLMRLHGALRGLRQAKGEMP